MADVSVVYNLIINAPDAQETLEELAGAAAETQAALGSMGDASDEVVGGMDEALSAVTGMNTGLGEITKSGRTSSRVLSGLATAVQHVSPEAAQAMRALSGMTRAMTAAGTAAAALGAIIAPLAIAVGALLLVYRQLAAAVEEAEARMTAAAEQAERAAAAHQQFKAGLVDVETQIKLINGEIDQFEVNRLQGVQRLEEAAAEQLAMNREALAIAQQEAATAQETLAATEQRNAAALQKARERVAAGEALTAPMQAALDAVESQATALQRANDAVSHQQDLLDGVTARLEEGRTAIAQVAEYGRESAEQADRERQAREDAAAAARATADAKKAEADAARELLQINAAISQAGLDPAEISEALKGDPAFIAALEEFAAAMKEAPQLLPDGVSAVDPALAGFRELLGELVPPEGLSQLERLQLAQSDLFTLMSRGQISAEEFSAALARLNGAIEQGAESARLQTISDTISGPLSSLFGGDLLGSASSAVSGVLAPFLGPAAPVVSIGLQIAGLLEGLGAAGLALEAQLEQARERGDEDTVREIEAAMERYGSASGAALADRIGSQIDNLAAGIGAAPSVIFNALPEILFQVIGSALKTALLLPINRVQALLRNFLNPGRFIRMIGQGMLDAWESIKAELKEFFDIFGNAQERFQERREGGFFAGLFDGDGRPLQNSGASSARSTSSSSASAAREVAAEVARLFAILDGRAGTLNTAAGGGLRRQFARLQQAQAGDRDGGGVRVTVNAVNVDPGTLPTLNQQMTRASNAAEFGKTFGRS